MLVEGTWRRAIEAVDSGGRFPSIRVLDQRRLPYEVAWLPLATVGDAATAIRDMAVRGAPLIGATAAYGVALALAADPDSLADATARLAATRPTAINLRWALDELRAAVAAVPRSERAAAAFAKAAAVCDDEVARCEAIGRHGVALLHAAHARHPGRPVQVLTHCNAGWLACVDWGTALAPIYRAHQDGVPVHVWVDETRPRNQGLLTAWELAQQGIPHTVIADNAGGHLMQRGEVELCIVGTDRTTREGDVCNKIGTYLKALAAHDCGVPFHVAAPSPSIDWTLARGADIPIEERGADEVRLLRGIEVMAPTTPVANPAFDVTPARLVTGFITERGLATPATLAALFGVPA